MDILRKKKWFFVLCCLLGTCDYNAADSNIEVHARSEGVFSSLFKRVTIITENGFVIHYYGCRYSKRLLEAALAECSSEDEIIVKLHSLKFDAMFWKFENGKRCLVIKDCLPLKSINFELLYKTDNLIHHADTQKGIAKLWKSKLINIVGLDLKAQSLKPIIFAEIKSGADKLKAAYEGLGYNYVDIGYKLVPDSANSRQLILTYYVTLGDADRNDIRFYGGDPALNTKVKFMSPRTPLSFFEFPHYVFIPFFPLQIQELYQSYGYYDVNVTSYYDNYKKHLVYNINEGEKYLIDDYSIDLIDDLGFSDKFKQNLKQKIDVILNSQNQEYSKSKVERALRALAKPYKEKGYLVNEVVTVNESNKTVFISFRAQLERTSLTKTLVEIRCSGNRQVGLERIRRLLDKKIGDLISNDDLQMLKRNLTRTECFRSVEMSLLDDPKGYVLNINVKEDRLLILDLPNLMVIPLGIDFIHIVRNIGSSPKNLVSSLSFARLESGAWHINCNQSWSFFLPKNESLQLSYGFRMIPETKLSSVSEYVFDRDSGKTAFCSISGNLCGFGMELSGHHAQHRVISGKMSSAQWIDLSVDLIKWKHRLGSHFYLSDDLSVTGGVRVKDEKDPLHFSISNNFYWGYQLTESIGLYSSVQAGCFAVLPHDEKRCWFTYYSIPGFEMGWLGPNEVINGESFIVGGDTYVGALLSVYWLVPYSLLPSGLYGMQLYITWEMGSVFNYKSSDMDIKRAVMCGVSIPILGVRCKIYYCVPFNKKERDGLYEGLNCIFSVDILAMMNQEVIEDC